MKKWIALGVVVAAGIGWFAYQRATESTPVRIAAVVQGEMRAYIDERAKTTLPHV